ncbi:hypothetical protein GAY31_13810 [Azospirillum brasilense]|nr:hypothetical protein [Azospirillum brasilense]
MLFVLNALRPERCDLQRLVSYDYLLLHSADVEGGPASLHPALPFRGGEWLVRRDIIAAGLDLMHARELLAKSYDRSGISYAGTELTDAFLGLLRNDYARSLANRSAWLAERFGAMPDEALSDFMRRNVGRWGAEFDRLAALRDLEL